MSLYGFTVIIALLSIIVFLATATIKLYVNERKHKAQSLNRVRANEKVKEGLRHLRAGDRYKARNSFAQAKEWNLELGKQDADNTNGKK